LARPPVFSVEDKFRLVLAVVSGEMTIVEAARRGKASEQSISRWKQQFLESGKAGLAGRLVRTGVSGYCSRKSRS
jgi:transposase